jgi:hypothetical protein
MWFGGAGDAAVDPEPFLRTFPVLAAPSEVRS